MCIADSQANFIVGHSSIGVAFLLAALLDSRVGYSQDFAGDRSRTGENTTHARNGEKDEARKLHSCLEIVVEASLELSRQVDGLSEEKASRQVFMQILPTDRKGRYLAPSTKSVFFSPVLAVVLATDTSFSRRLSDRCCRQHRDSS